MLRRDAFTDSLFGGYLFSYTVSYTRASTLTHLSFNIVASVTKLARGLHRVRLDHRSYFGLDILGTIVRLPQLDADAAELVLRQNNNHLIIAF